MNTLKLLWTALAQLGASLANLAETINGIDGQLRQRTGLDEKPALVEGNGRAEPLCRLCAKPISPAEGTVHDRCADEENFRSQTAARKRTTRHEQARPGA